MRLTQVLVNLISNASKYGPLDRPIGLDLLLEDADTLKVSVSDQGSGISIQDRETIFRRFIRLDEKDQAQFGVGLDCRWSRPSWKVMAGGWVWIHARAVGTSSGSRCHCGIYYESAGGG